MESGDTPFVDVCFRLRGEQIPLDHGYPLYGAVSRKLPAIHEDNEWGIHPIYGQRLRPGILEIRDASRLKIRLPASAIEEVLPLAGSSLDVDGHGLRVGVPEVHSLSPSTSLKSRYVTIKGFMEPEEFSEAVRRQLDDLELDTETTDVNVGERRVMEIDGYTIVGFRMAIGGLETEESMVLQRTGVGGRRKMGAGIFRPRDGEADDDG